MKVPKQGAFLKRRKSFIINQNVRPDVGCFKPSYGGARLYSKNMRAMAVCERLLGYVELVDFKHFVGAQKNYLGVDAIKIFIIVAITNK